MSDFEKYCAKFCENELPIITNIASLAARRLIYKLVVMLWVGVVRYTFLEGVLQYINFWNKHIRHGIMIFSRRIDYDVCDVVEQRGSVAGGGEVVENSRDKMMINYLFFRQN